MACRFALPVSDAAELSVRANAVPSNTKSMTEWGVRVWTEWASSRAVSPSPDEYISKSAHYIFIAQLSVH